MCLSSTSSQRSHRHPWRPDAAAAPPRRDSLVTLFYHSSQLLLRPLITAPLSHHIQLTIMRCCVGTTAKILPTKVFISTGNELVLILYGVEMAATSASAAMAAIAATVIQAATAAVTSA